MFRRIAFFFLFSGISFSLLGGCLSPVVGNYGWMLAVDWGGLGRKTRTVETPVFSPSEGSYSGDQSVEITTTTKNAKIYYTIGDDLPDASSTEYEGPIAVSGDGATLQINAIAIRSGMRSSKVASASFTIDYSRVSTPQFSPKGGDYTTDRSVKITTDTEGASIYYTTDESTPTTESTKYTNTSIPVSEGTTILRAIAVKTGMNDSTVAEARYSIVYENPDTTTQAATPTFSPAEGLYNTDQSVSLSTTTPGAKIYYTTDGITTPTTASTKYTTSIAVSEANSPLTIQAIAVAEGYDESEVAEATYTVDYDKVSDVQFSPTPGDYNSNQSITLTCDTDGSSIYYTTDNTEPATSVTGTTLQYNTPIQLNGEETYTIKAVGVAPGYEDGNRVSANYTIDYSLLSAATPIISPVAGSYPSTRLVEITTTTPVATLYYTTDGSTPTTESEIYLSSFALTDDMVVKAMAVKEGLANSIVAVKTYRVANTGQVGFYPAPGDYTFTQNVKLSSSTPGVNIYYTTDGSEPTTSSNLYSSGSPITVDSSQTIRAIAVKTGYNDSPVSAATYGITASPTKYPLGGWVSGLYDGTIVLQRDGVDDLTITKNGPFAFATPVVNGSYAITIASGPDNGQTCRIDTDNSFSGSNSTATVSGAAVNSIAVVCGPVSLPVADSGQTGCYYYSGGWTLDSDCSQNYTVGNTNYPYGQDGHNVDTPSARSFTGPTQHGTYTDDYTTTDNVTGIVWKTCNEGLSGPTCATGGTTIMDWITAGAACNALNDANSGAGYAGRRDWRLPTKAELESIPNYGTSNPAIDTGYFPGMVASTYWSASNSVSYAAGAWAVYFGYGFTYITSDRVDSYYVRCLAGGKVAPPVFSDNGNATVSNQTTELTWEKCGMGYSRDANCSDNGSTSDNTTNWSNALAYCETLSLGGITDWRLPNINELKSIIDETQAHPSINDTTFPGTVASYYRSSSTADSYPGEAWRVFFNSGETSSGGHTVNHYVRCVTGP